MMPEIDLDALLKNPLISTSLSINSVKEENPNDAKVRRYKEIILFSLASVMVLSVFIICTGIVVNTDFESNANRWAMTIDSDIVSAFLALLVGRKLG